MACRSLHRLQCIGERVHQHKRRITIGIDVSKGIQQAARPIRERQYKCRSNLLVFFRCSVHLGNKMAKDESAHGEDFECAGGNGRNKCGRE